MKTVIYHSADFDGIFCRETAKAFLGEKDVTYIGWNFGDMPLPIPSEGEVVIMDLPVDKVFGATIRESGIVEGHLPAEMFKRLIWIDHHATAIASHPRDIPGYRIDGVAACRLAWQWFSRPHHEGKHGECLPTKAQFFARSVYEPRAVRLAGEYDVWDKRDPHAELFQLGLKAVPEIEFSRLLDPIERVASLAACELIEIGRLVHQYVVNQNFETMKRTAHHRKWRGLNFLFANLAIGNSQSFDSAVTPETDALLMWRHDGRKVCVSLYGVPDHPEHDLSVIARSLGGGGHKQACGFEIGISDFLCTILFADEFDNVTTE